MLTLLLAALMTSSVPPADVCEVGRVAIRDVPSLNGNARFDAYYDANDPLLEMCPQLRKEIPAGYPLSDLDARARANSHVPMRGQAIRPAFIYFIGLPKFSADRRKATFDMGYSCTGLCGASFVAHYVRTPNGWQRDGQVRITSVS